MSLPAVLTLLLAAPTPGAEPTLQARFLGNAAFEISDGRTTLLTDFPYRSGAFGYMDYDAAELSARPGSICLITHAHADHFDPTLAARVGCRVIGSPTPGAATVGLPAGLAITPVPTAHADIAHFSYLVAWNGRRLYFTGDTESTAELAQTGALDVLFITPWLLEAARTARVLPKAARIVVYHHRAGEKVAGCGGCVVPRQGQVIEIPDRAGIEAVVTAASAGSPRLALLGVPWDGDSSYLRGAAGAPPFIRAAYACDSSNFWAENGIEIPPAAFFDAGDVAVASESGETRSRIEAAVGDLLDRGLSPISLGGDHSITYPILRAFARKYPRLSILHFDAHPDLYDELMGNRFSHGCPFARIMEEGLAQRLVQAGIRAANPHGRAQAARFGAEMLEMKDWKDDRPIRFDSPVYISFDLDALDPACAPGVSHREPGGLTTRQAIDLIHRMEGPVVGADIVELNPTQDVSGLTAMVCGRLVKEIAAKMLAVS